ncbi:MAG: hypothetical protein OEZ06_30865 [Myxococcales bacterium]|nr:hypothetical protein [Myxococcales bacterium]
MLAATGLLFVASLFTKEAFIALPLVRQDGIALGQRDLLCDQVGAEVPLGAGHRQAADLHRRHPIAVDVDRHATTRKKHRRAVDVGSAVRVDSMQRGLAEQAGGDVDIVDGQVDQHVPGLVHVLGCTADAACADVDDLAELTLGDQALHGYHGGIEALHVPHHQCDAVLLGQGEQALPLGSGGRDRLLDQDREACADDLAGDVVVGFGRRCDHRGFGARGVERLGHVVEKGRVAHSLGRKR